MAIFSLSSSNTGLTLKMEGNCIPRLCVLMLTMLTCFATIKATESDISCLRSIKESLEDPSGFLSNWNFSNNSAGFICRFTGVECWRPTENKVFHIRLPGMRLRGPFPMGIRNCDSLIGLNLSNNYLSGPIPSNISKVLPFITTLDLSNNTLTGPIPPGIANCTLINVLMLDNNHLTGQIPPEFSKLERIKEFSVANNRLSGAVPVFSNTSFPAESYANNSGLCGGPMNACSNDNDDLFFPGFAVGFPISTILSMLFMFLCWPRLRIRTSRYYPFWIKKRERRTHHLIPRNPQVLFAENVSSMETKVSAMEKFICRFRLMELEMATNDFDNKNVIGYGNMGLMYKGECPKGLLVAIKRLHRFESFEKEFLSEIEILGRLSHTNLVQMLGFCFEMERKFLVYKYMSNGTLHQWLYGRSHQEAMKMGWTLRLKIAVGVAKGIAWLHHNNVLHLKINSKCILLDDKFEPKISNFGNAIILIDTSDTPLSDCNFIVPDSSPYKDDVYSFGILLLELVTSREPSTWINSLTDYVWGVDFDLIDECLMGQGFDEEIYEILKIAKNCIHPCEDEATNMLQVYQAMCAIGTSRNEISLVSYTDLENNQRDV